MHSWPYTIYSWNDSNIECNVINLQDWNIQEKCMHPVLLSRINRSNLNDGSSSNPKKQDQIWKIHSGNPKERVQNNSFQSLIFYIKLKQGSPPSFISYHKILRLSVSLERQYNNLDSLFFTFRYWDWQVETCWSNFHMVILQEESCGCEMKHTWLGHSSFLCLRSEARSLSTLVFWLSGEPNLLICDAGFFLFDSNDESLSFFLLNFAIVALKFNFRVIITPPTYKMRNMNISRYN